MDVCKFLVKCMIFLVPSDKTLEEVFDSENFQSYVCGSIILYYYISSDVYVAVDRPSSCSIMQLPVTQNSVAKSNNSGLFHQLSDRFTLSWTVSEECNACYYRGGMCQTKNATKEFYCHNTYRGKELFSMFILKILVLLFSWFNLHFLCFL